MKKYLAIAVVIIIGSGFVWYTTRGDGPGNTSFRFVEVERGDVEAVVSSTGNLSAIKMVPVGTQVSGIVDRLYVDFNDPVRQGQLLAQIDTTLLVTAIQEAQTTIVRNQAQLDFARSEYDRIKGLHEKQFATDVELNQSRYNLQTAQATVTSGQLNHERAERNLSFANIYSPVNGVVIERNVDEGETVQASMTTPQLYLIAEDLSRLQILTSVDESDIGRIHEGQVARFTVQAHDERVFEGRVRQVRLQSAIQENIVTYTVVVDVDNADGNLLPGMTATVDFLVETVTDVLKVPNAGLRFRPSEEMLADLMASMQAERAARQDSAGGETRRGGFQGMEGENAPAGGNGFQGAFQGSGGATRPETSQLWYVDEAGQVRATRVRIGVSDGQFTEITGPSVVEGMQIIAGITAGPVEDVNTNPFQQQQGGFRRPGGF